jgi:hypothetical protein
MSSGKCTLNERNQIRERDSLKMAERDSHTRTLIRAVYAIRITYLVVFKDSSF